VVYRKRGIFYSISTSHFCWSQTTFKLKLTVNCQPSRRDTKDRVHLNHHLMSPGLERWYNSETEENLRQRRIMQNHQKIKPNRIKSLNWGTLNNYCTAACMW
jgi:hypothetical protein